jgi:hypothetical protein
VNFSDFASGGKGDQVIETSGVEQKQLTRGLVSDLRGSAFDWQGKVERINAPRLFSRYLLSPPGDPDNDELPSKWLQRNKLPVRSPNKSEVSSQVTDWLKLKGAMKLPTLIWNSRTPPPAFPATVISGPI